MKEHCVYFIYNTINGKIYVGKSSELEKRWSRHKRVALGGKEKYPNTFSIIHAAMRKYGHENFIFKIVENFSTEEEALSRETEWILTLRSLNYLLYNLTNGGEGSSGYTHTPEAKKKMSTLNGGENNPRYGAIVSDEFRQKMKVIKNDPILKEKVSLQFSGENNYNAKLTTSQVEEIKILLSQGISQLKIAKMFAIKQPQVSRIKLGLSWKSSNS